MIESYDSIMCEYFCIDLVDFTLNNKSLTEFTSPFLPENFRENYKKKYVYF